MSFSIFIWGIVVLAFVYVNICERIFHNLNKFVSVSYLKGVLFLISVTWMYISVSDLFWIQTNENVFPLIESSFLLKEIWFTIVFFKDIWLGFFTALTVIATEKCLLTKHYRILKIFGHSKILILVASFAMYIICSCFQIFNLGKLTALNIIIYTAVHYWRLGWATLLYTSKQFYKTPIIGICITLISPVLAGEHFLIPVILVIGVGISDIWMDYQKRETGAHLFSLNFN